MPDILIGSFHIIWEDPIPGSGRKPSADYIVIDSKNQWHRIEKTTKRFSHEEALEHDGNDVLLIGNRMWGQASLFNNAKIAHVGKRRPHFPPIPPLVGSFPFVVLRCNFADVPTNILTHEWLEDLMGPEYPGVDHFWQEQSGGKVNLEGTQVFGLFQMPRVADSYLMDKNGDGVMETNLPLLQHDCVRAADSHVFFPDFYGIFMVFNKRLEPSSWAGKPLIKVDGVRKEYGLVWTWEDHVAQSVGAHEVGHIFGLAHSLTEQGEQYASAWDCMSGGYFLEPGDQFGMVCVNTPGFNQKALGWIPRDRVYKIKRGVYERIRLERLGEPTADGYLVIEIPVAPNRMYSCDARRFAGYDERIPDEAVICHSVNRKGYPSGTIVDEDHNGNPNDEGAMLKPGETFCAANEKCFTVDSMDQSGFWLRIN